MVSSARAGAPPKTPRPSATPPALCSKRRRDNLLTRSNIHCSFVRAGDGDIVARPLPYRRSLALPLYLTFLGGDMRAIGPTNTVVHVRRRPPRIPQRNDAFWEKRQPRRAHRGRAREFFRARRRSGVADRAERLRQEHATQHRLRAHGAERGPSLRRRRESRRAERPRRL